jgi:hypothetical protein
VRDDGWSTLEEFLKDSMVVEMLRLYQEQVTYINTRRTVEVTARKHRARRRRRRK